MSATRCGDCLPCRLAEKDRRYEVIPCKGGAGAAAAGPRPQRDPSKPRISITDLAGKKRH